LDREDRNVPENVSIAYRGANYAIGQGPQFYGIWHAAAAQAQPIEWWPLTPEGWSGAWSRFASIEAPGSIAPVTEDQVVAEQPAGEQPVTEPAVTQQISPAPTASAPDSPTVTRNARIAAGLLGLGVVLGIAGLFPAYLAGASLASQASEVVPHAIYLAAWGLSGVLLLLGGMRLRAGALIGVGVSAVTFGLFFADAGTPMAGGTHLMGAGLVLSILGWAACTAGAGLASWTSLSVRTALGRNGVVSQPGQSRFLGMSGHETVPVMTLMLAALGAAIAFAPSWDRFTLVANGLSRTITAGNAFANPVPVIIGDVLVMVALVAVIIAAALWRPRRLGAALAVGALVPMVAQALSAVVQINGAGATSPLQFGMSQAEANQLGLTISAGLTPMFWVFCGFIATLILLCVWLLLAHDSAAPGNAASYPAGPYSAAPYSAAPYSAAPHTRLTFAALRASHRT
jgi:hypothetical protein